MSDPVPSELIAPPHQSNEPEGKVQKERASDAVARRLRSDIISGRLPAGCRLLPERKLAQVLGVSRVTVRSAIATLLSEQLLDVRRGSGITVLDFRDSSNVDMFEWIITVATQDKKKLYQVFKQGVQMRRFVAVPTLFDAATKATDDFRIILHRMIEKQRTLFNEPEAYSLGDWEISRFIARQADNLMIEILHNSLKRTVLNRVDLLAAFIGPPEEHFEGYAMIVELCSQGPDITENLQVRQQAALLIEQFEVKGLERTRRYIQGLPDPSQESPTADLFQKGKQV